jgi:hypothetical protein
LTNGEFAVRTKSILVVVLSTLLAVGVVWKLLSPGPQRAIARALPAEQSQVTAGPDPNAAMQRQINQLQLRVMELQQQVAQNQAAAASSANASAALLPASDPPAEPEQERKQLQDHMDEVTAEFHAESRNAPWARDRAAEFQTSIDKHELLKKAIQSIECRTSMCRLEMLDDRSQKFFMQFNEMVMSTASNFPSMSGQRVKRPDGTPVTVYYFTKEST